MVASMFVVNESSEFYRSTRNKSIGCLLFVVCRVCTCACAREVWHMRIAEANPKYVLSNKICTGKYISCRSEEKSPKNLVPQDSWGVRAACTIWVRTKYGIMRASFRRLSPIVSGESKTLQTVHCLRCDDVWRQCQHFHYLIIFITLDTHNALLEISHIS